MEFINLKKCKQKIIQNKYNNITLNFYYFIAGLLLLLISYPSDESTNNFPPITILLNLFGFLISYLIHDKKNNFYKTIFPIFVVIYIRYLMYYSVFFLLLIFFNYQVFDSSINDFIIGIVDFFVTIIIWLNILMNFHSVQKNSNIFNKLKS